MPNLWTTDAAVRGFVTAPPNDRLLRFAAAELDTRGGVATALDIGCGAARNLVPLVTMGWRVLGVDTSMPMLHAAAHRIAATARPRAHLVAGSMHHLPILDARCDLVIAHGIWNLARSDAEFRAAIAEAARVIRPGGALFVFTFSRQTLAPEARPVSGQHFTFTDFSGEPQCFVTEGQLLEELSLAGFDRDEAVPLTEHNRPRAGTLLVSKGPVIYEGSFRRMQSAG
jgi:SAM-dependent methyltransferase